MKLKNIVKIILDIVMAGLFIVLLFAYQPGLAFHEIIGLSVLVPVVMHMVLNGNWIVCVSKNLLSGQLKAKTVFMYILNILLLIGVLTITVTGFLISKVLFPVLEYDQTLTTLHRWTAYVTAGMMGVHLLLHLKYLAVMFKKIFLEMKSPIVRRTLSGAVAIIFITGIVYYSVISATEKSMYSGIAETTSNGRGANHSYATSDTGEETSSEDSKKEENGNAITSSEPTTEAISLSDFLGKMFCNLCPKHCPLSNPQCGKSASLIKEATTEYNEQYSG